jgi:Flp pilus assembly protein TadD
VPVDPVKHAAQTAARNRRYAQIAAGTTTIFLLIVSVLWFTREPEPQTTAPTIAREDPLATRRNEPAAESTPSAASAATDRPFMEPTAQGYVAYQAGDLNAALARFEDAVKRNPNDAESFSNLGQVLVKLGRVEDAMPHFQRACTLMPGRWAYRFNLARAEGLLGNWDGAVASYRQAQQLFPDDYVTTFNLAMALHKKGDEAGAVAEYEKAIALEPNDPSFRLALAISYEKLQKRQEAAAAYAEYLRLSPDAADADKVRARIALLTGTAAPQPPSAGVQQ